MGGKGNGEGFPQYINTNEPRFTAWGAVERRKRAEIIKHRQKMS